jgi:hypothetical protein
LCTANCWVYFTLSWDPPLDDMRNNISIYGYRFYYSTTQSGPPYTGTYSTRGNNRRLKFTQSFFLFVALLSYQKKLYEKI